jgi:2-polyprenyl-3-methyl-5-hydroxy-6-metoxy-1,4-benzoquinol methylase
MKENRYDDKDFFDQYSKMTRSTGGLTAAGEWHEFQRLLPDLRGKKVLDLGCGYGWHCRYAVEHGAQSVVGTDISEKMIEEAKIRTTNERISYRKVAIEDIDFSPESFDLIISSLAFHYVESFEPVCKNLYWMMKRNGVLVFSVEHPIFTTYGNQDWVYDQDGNKLHWPVDRYFSEGKREAVFLGQKVIKYHRTLTTYLCTLVNYGFSIRKVIEPMPTQEMMETDEIMRDELRRPMMLLVAAHKT